MSIEPPDSNRLFIVLHNPQFWRFFSCSLSKDHKHSNNSQKKKKKKKNEIEKCCNHSVSIAIYTEWMKQNTNKPVNAVTVFRTWMNIACHYCYCFHYYFVFTTVLQWKTLVRSWNLRIYSHFIVWHLWISKGDMYSMILYIIFLLFFGYKKPSNTSNEIIYHTWRTPLVRVRSRAHYAFCLYDFWWLFISFNRDFVAPFWYTKSRPILLLWSACAFDLV